MATQRDCPSFSVLVLDMFHYMDENKNEVFSGFATLEQAREYARRRTRDTLEEQRQDSKSPEDLCGAAFKRGQMLASKREQGVSSWEMEEEGGFGGVVGVVAEDGDVPVWVLAVNEACAR